MEAQEQDIVVGREAIQRRVGELAEQIAADYQAEAGRDEGTPCITILAVLTGSLIFLADLVRRMPMLMRLRLITVSSYPGKATESQGAELRSQLPDDLAGAHVLIVDDILDSGQTIGLVRRVLAEQGPASVRTCMLLRKQRPAAMRTPAEYIGFDIPDRFVVGYGLDHDGLYRNLPDVVALDEPSAADNGRAESGT